MVIVPLVFPSLSLSTKKLVKSAAVLRWPGKLKREIK